MTLHLGTVPASSTLYIPFATYDSAGASVTMTGLAVTDIEIYKDGSVTQRSSDAGYSLLDTDGIDFDSTTGIHGFSVDLSDNTDSGFYAVGSFYWVVVASVTVSSQTVNFIAATFRIGPAEAVTGYQLVDVGAISGDTTAADNLESYSDGTTPQPVNVTQISADSTAADNLEADYDGTGYAKANSTIGTCTTNTDMITTAEVNAEVVDALNADTYSEPGQGAPTATPTIRQMVHYLYKSWRNKSTQTATTYTLFADDTTTTDQAATCSDDGTTATKGEVGTGA